MKKIIISTTALAASFLTGYGVSSYLNNTLASSIGIGTGSALFGGGVTWLYCDTKLKRVSRELENKISTLKNDLDKLQLTSDNFQEKYNLVSQQLKEAKLEARIELTEKETYLKEVLQQLTNEKLLTVAKEKEASNLLIQVKELKDKLSNMTALYEEFKSQAELKESELQAFEREFHNRVEVEYQQRLKKEVEIESAYQFELLEESLQILADMDRFVNEVYQRHQSQRHYTLDIKDRFFDYKQKSDEKKEQAYNDLLGVNSELEKRIELLQMQLDNGLIQPVYGNYGIASTQGTVINGMIEWCFRHLQIAFKALKFEENEDGIVSFGLDYPKKLNPKDICEKIQQHKNTLQSFLGIWQIVRIEYLPKYDAIAISYRHQAPKPESDDEIYKAGLVPASQFCDVIFKACDHTTQGKPTLRIMAATGEGKGIVSKNLVAYFSELNDWEIWVSDPLHGSDQDYWDCPKIAKNKNESKQAYKLFVQLHRTRKDDKVDGFTSRYVLGIFDEFDKQHSDSDKETAKDIMTAIRHSRQRQILIGQTAEVGANGWQWDDMKNCALLVLGDSIGTLCKHLVKDLGWTLKKANAVKAGYEKFSSWAQKKNDSNPDIPNENAYRIGLLIVGSKYQFLEIPNAHKGIIRSGKAVLRDSLAVAQIQSDSNQTTDVCCPYCGSTAVKKNGKRNDGTQYYTCTKCTKTPKKWVV